MIKRSYYQGTSGRDVIDVIYDFSLDWISGDILKRLVRMGKKEGQSKADDWRKIVEEAQRGLHETLRSEGTEESPGLSDEVQEVRSDALYVPANAPQPKIVEARFNFGSNHD